jgi:hypothetical protein
MSAPGKLVRGGRPGSRRRQRSRIVRGREQRRGHFEPERVGGLEIDDEPVLGRRLYR